jgi:hypothetical protein
MAVASAPSLSKEEWWAGGRNNMGTSRMATSMQMARAHVSVAAGSRTASVAGPHVTMSGAHHLASISSVHAAAGTGSRRR